MANAYSTIHQYGEPKSNFDVELAASVLRGKQQKFDSNLMQIEQTLASMGIQADSIKNEAGKEKLYNNITQMIGSIQNLNSQDLSKRGVTSEIIGKIQGALDEDSIYHISAGRTIDKFNSSVQESIEAGDGSYNENNYRDAVIKSGLQEYLQGDASARLTGNLTFYKNVDYHGELMKWGEKAKKLQGKRIVETVLPDGSIKKETVDNLTAEGWYQQLQRAITPEMQRQMEIDGAAMFNWDLENFEGYKENYRGQMHSMADEQIKRLESELKQDLPKDVRYEIEKELEVYRNSKENVDEIVDSGLKDLHRVGGELVKEDLVTNLARLMGSGASLEWRNIKRADDNNTTNTRNKANNILPTGMDFARSVRKETEHKKIKVADIVEDHNTAKRDYRISTNRMYSSLPDELQQSVDTSVETKLENNPGMTREDALFSVLDTFDYEKEHPKGFTKTQSLLEEMRLRKEQLDTREKKMSEIYDQVNEDLWVEDYKKYFKWLHVDRSNRGVGEMPLVGKILEDNNITNEEEYLDFIQTEEGRELKGVISSAIFLKQVLDDTGKNHRMGVLNRTEEGELIYGVNITPEFLNRFEIAKKDTKEQNLQLTDVFDFTDKQGRSLDEIQVSQAISGGQEINATLKKGTDSTLVNNMEAYVRKNDTRFKIHPNVDALHKVRSKKQIERKFQEYYKDSDISLRGDNIIILPTFSGEKGQREELFRDAQAFFSAAEDSKGKIDQGGPDLKLEIDGDRAIITQKNYSTTIGVYEAIASLSLPEFIEAAPNIYGMLEEFEQTDRLVYSDPEGVRAKNYITTSNTRIFNGVSRFIGDDITPLVYKSGVEDYVLGGYQEGGETYNLFKRAIDDPSKFVVDFEKDEGEDYIVVSTAVPKGTEEDAEIEKGEVYRLDVTGMSKTEIGKIRRNYPQYFVSLALKDLSIKIQNGLMEDNTEFENFEKVYGNR